jgi:D-arabinose 1-dehydrogenase-like Zn-dependent alcohol dehydrogenase
VTMRAMELAAFGEPLRPVTRPVPRPGPGEVRIRIEACGVCGSDLFLQKGGFGRPLPIIPGHEAAGRVDELGDGVTGFEPGQQVALAYIHNRGGAPSARDGRPNLGAGVERMGVDVDGAFAEYVVRPATSLVPVPRELDPAVLAVLTDAVGTPFHALSRVGRVQPGELVLVLGIGGIGSNAVQVARHLGATVIAATRNLEKLELAGRLGATTLIRSGDDLAARVLEATDGQGPDVVVQCADSEVLDRLALEMVRPGGRVIYVGVSVEPFALRSSDIIWREATLLGSRGFTGDDIADVVDLYLSGKIVADHLVETRRPLEEANEALDDLRAGRVLRSVLAPMRGV